MAGKPRTRAREAAAAADIPDAESADPNAPAGDARVHAPRTRARGGGRTQPQRPQPGQKTKATGDRAQATAMGNVAEQMAPGVVVSIERTKPSWCAGWLEDYIVDSGDPAELREYIRDEYGGRAYKLTALAAGGAPLWVSKLTIGGKPKEDGKTIIRWQYEGEANPATPPPVVQPAAAAGGFNMDAIVNLAGIVLGSYRESSQAQLEAVRETVAASRADTTRLMELIVTERSEEKRGTDFVGQLGQLVEGTKALKKAGSYFGAAADGPAASDDSGLLQGAAKHAMERLITNAMDAEAAPPQRTRAPATHTRRPPAGPVQSGIPEAISRPEPPN